MQIIDIAVVPETHGVFSPQKLNKNRFAVESPDQLPQFDGSFGQLSLLHFPVLNGGTDTVLIRFTERGYLRERNVGGVPRPVHGAY